MDDYNIFSLEHENNLIDLFQKVNQLILFLIKRNFINSKNEMIYSNCTLPIFVQIIVIKIIYIYHFIGCCFQII